MMTYRIVERKKLHTGERLYYPQLVTPLSVSHVKIIERIEKKCTLASADVKAVIDALEVEIIDCLQEGHSVRLGDLGAFRPSLRCTKGQKKREDVTSAAIKRVHIVFHPSTRIRRALSVKDHAVAFRLEEKGKVKKKPGTTPTPGAPSGGTGGSGAASGGSGAAPVPGGSPSIVPTPAAPSGGTGAAPVPGGSPSIVPTPAAPSGGSGAAPVPGGSPSIVPTPAAPSGGSGAAPAVVSTPAVP